MIAWTPAFEITNVSCESNRSLSMTATCSATSGRPSVFGAVGAFSVSSMGGGGGIIFGALASSVVVENNERTKPSSSSRIVDDRGAD